MPPWSFKMLSLDVIIIAVLIWATQQTVGLEFCSQLGESCSANTKDYSEFIGRYTFPTTPIKNLECRSEEAMTEIKKGFPVVLKNCHFGEITKAWTTEYLKENLISPNLTVYKSATRRFLFYNRENVEDAVANMSWSPPHNATEMSFVQFLSEMDELESAGNGTKIYLQTGLEKELLNSDMQDDVLMFNTKWLRNLKENLSWGRLDVNLFLFGMGGVVTPAHYDIMENLFLQIYGKKRCILFSPENYKFLYPYPVHHPHDRQTQVNFDFPDFEKFPKFRNIAGIDAVLEPGDVLYIPNYWWHYIESERESKTMSMNFWYLPKGAEDDEIVKNADSRKELVQNRKEILRDQEIRGGKQMINEMTKVNETEPVPYTAGELIGLTRDIEAMIGDALGDVTKVGTFLKGMVDGRYDYV